MQANTTTVEVQSTLPSLVDELADLAAKIAVLEAREKVVKAKLVESNLHEICGLTHRAVVSVIPASKTTDYRAACDKYLTAEQVAAFEKPKAGYPVVKLYGYN